MAQWVERLGLDPQLRSLSQGCEFGGGRGAALGPTLGMAPTSKQTNSGAWVVQSVEHLTLDCSSGHDLALHSTEPAWDSLSLSLCPSPARSHMTVCALSSSLSQNKPKQINKEKKL